MPDATDTLQTHESPAKSREVFYERARSAGCTPEAARDIAEKATRGLHDKLDRLGEPKDRSRRRGGG